MSGRQTSGELLRAWIDHAVASEYVGVERTYEILGNCIGIRSWEVGFEERTDDFGEKMENRIYGESRGLKRVHRRHRVIVCKCPD